MKSLYFWAKKDRSIPLVAYYGSVFVIQFYIFDYEMNIINFIVQ